MAQEWSAASVSALGWSAVQESATTLTRSVIVQATTTPLQSSTDLDIETRTIVEMIIQTTLAERTTSSNATLNPTLTATMANTALFSSNTSAPSPNLITDTKSFKIGIAAASAVAGLLFFCSLGWFIRRRQSSPRPFHFPGPCCTRNRRPPSSILCPTPDGIRRCEQRVWSPDRHNSRVTWSMYSPHDPYRILQDTPATKAGQPDWPLAVVGLPPVH